MCVDSDCGMVLSVDVRKVNAVCQKRSDDRNASRSSICRLFYWVVSHIKSMNQWWNILLTIERKKCPQCEYYQTYYNACYKCNNSYSGPKLEIQHLMIFLLADNYVNRYKMVGDLDTFRDIFWSHSDCIKLLMLSTVLLMNSTYKINTYR